MEKHRAIPEGYMTVGEIAKKAGITVRTMHHYDKAGLLSPSSESEGGYRLYSYKDVVKLNQILSMKYLGFSLDDIKNRLVSLDTPSDVASALAEHAIAIRNKMETLAESLKAVEKLREEVVQMQSVDFKKYADIVAHLQMKNENYWAIKHIDNDVMNHFHDRYSHDKGAASAVMESWERMSIEAESLHEKGVSPESEEGQIFAKEFWGVIQETTGGDINIIAKLAESLDKLAESEEEAASLKGTHRDKIEIAYNFIKAALDAYFIKLGYDPF